MKKFIFSAAAMLILSSCAVSEESIPPDIDNSKSYSQEKEHFFTEDSDDYIPLNFTNQHGLWLPYMDFENYMHGKSEEEYRDAVKKILTDAKSDDINTIYFHVHPNGDAYYDSEIFPRGTFYDGDYDPLEIMLEIAHSIGISVHAWLNPYRLQTVDQANDLSDDFIIKKWLNEGSPMVKEVNGRYYLDPSYSEVTELICQAADEILEKYDVDGIHIDDYFYPASDEEFDREEFAKSQSSDLAQWRRDNINSMVKGLYNTVKSHGKRLKFGVSPQGNIDTDYNKQYADVKLWSGEDGYADYIVPQIYYGFKNATLPFESTLHQWETLTENSNVSLIIGLAEYKLGKADQWAGAAGENEWIDDPDIIKKQVELVDSSSADGYAFYR